MKPAPFDFARADTLDDAVSLLASAGSEARPLAGGQSLGPMLNLRLARPSKLIDLSRIDALRAFEDDDDGVTVGAMTPHAAFEDGDVPDVANGLIRHAASGIAYRAVRNRGTIGGSLAHADPAADWPPVMIALGATLVVHNGDGGREVAAGEFITDPLTTVLEPSEVLAAIRIPRISGDATWGHYKVCVKPGDFAQSLGVVVIDRARGHVRAVQAGPTSPPLQLGRVAEMLANTDGWHDSLADEIKSAATADIRDAGFVDDSDSYALNLHRTVAVRAAREALTP